MFKLLLFVACFLPFLSWIQSQVVSLNLNQQFFDAVAQPNRTKVRAMVAQNRIQLDVNFRSPKPFCSQQWKDWCLEDATPLIALSVQCQLLSNEGSLELFQLLFSNFSQLNVDAREKLRNLTAFNFAAGFCNNPAIGRLFLSNGAAVNVFRSESSPLIFAARYGRLEMVQLLLERGATLNKRDYDGMTPLMWAAKNGHVAVVRFLIRSGVGINFKNLRGESALFLASANNHLEVVQQLLEAGAGLFDDRTFEGQSALQVAALKGFRAVAQALIDNGADQEGCLWEPCRNAPNYATQLFEACQTGNLTKIRSLYDLNLDFDINLRQQGSGHTCLHLTLQNCRSLTSNPSEAGATIELVRFLLENQARTGPSGNLSSIGLTLAQCQNTSRANVRIARLLIEKNSTLIQEKFSHLNGVYQNFTPLIFAAYSNDFNLVELFIDYGAPLDQPRDGEGQTALFWASRWGLTETVRYLVQRGASLNLRDKSGLTLLMLAARQQDAALVRYYLAEGVFLDPRDNFNRTALHWAEWSDPQFEKDLPSEAIAKLILENGPILRNNSGLLVAAVRNDHPDVLQRLMDRNLNLEERDSETGQTPLLWACRLNRTQMAQGLIRKGSLVNVRAGLLGGSATPLTLAARAGNSELVRLLLGRGAEVNARDGQGFTALMRAASEQHVETARRLIQAGASLEGCTWTPCLRN